MRTWDVFFPDVLPEVLGCPEPSVERALLKASRVFCERTGCWREDLPAITTSGQPSEFIPYDKNAAAVRFIAATLNGKNIGLDAMDSTSAADRQAGTSGATRILSWDKRSVQILPRPAAGQSLVITAILKPSQDAKGVPDFIAEDLRDEIASGALAELLAQKSEWFNPTKAQQYAADFDKAIGRVQTRVWKAHSNARPRQRPNYF